MATTYPTSVDTLSNPISSNTLASPSHSAQHADSNDAIEAVETKLGTGASVPTTTGHVLTVTGAGATGYAAPASVAPTGAAGGDLSGTYPDPSVVDDSHAHTSTTVTPAGIGASATGHAHTHSSTTGQTANDHHSQAHVLATDIALGADHTISGGIAGYVLRALGATTAKFMQLLHSDLGSIGTDDHHAKVHAHSSAGEGGTIAHSATTGQTATDHHPAPAAGPDADVTIDAAGAAGTASTFARSGHGHKVATYASAVAAVGTAAAGTSGTAPARGDHVHATGAGTPSTQAFGDSAVVGTGPAAAMTDHKHAMPSERAAASTTPAAIGTAAVGSGTTDARADHVHATGAGTPTTQAFGDAAVVGSGPAASMTDHKHAMPTGTAGPDADVTIDAAGAAGTANTAARAAHGHKLATYASAGATLGTAAAGTSTTAPARGDHVHGHGTGTVANAHAHADLSGVSANQHHNQAHAISGADHTGFSTGTSVPGSPATNDLCFRTDRGILYQYDGTRWLSQPDVKPLIPQLGANGYAATTAEADRLAPPYAGVYDLWLVEFQLSVYVSGGTALDASNKWVATLNKVDGGASTLLATININSGASGSWRTMTAVAIGALLGTGHDVLNVTYTKTGTPGTLYAVPSLAYRLVG